MTTQDSRLQEPAGYADLRRRAEQATPGPWWSENGLIVADSRRSPGNAMTVARVPGDGDHAYIAAANPQTILALLDELRDEAAARQQALDVIVEQADRVAALDDWMAEKIEYLEGLRAEGHLTATGDAKVRLLREARALLAERSIGPDQLADLRQLVNEPGPVCDIPWAAGPANAMCLRCGNRFDEHTQAQPASEAGDER